MQLPLITEDGELKHYVFALIALVLTTFIIVTQTKRISQSILAVRKYLVESLSTTETDRIWRKTDRSIERVEASWVDVNYPGYIP